MKYSSNIQVTFGRQLQPGDQVVIPRPVYEHHAIVTNYDSGEDELETYEFDGPFPEVGGGGLKAKALRRNRKFEDEDQWERVVYGNKKHKGNGDFKIH